jgi:hypothetical protein
MKTLRLNRLENSFLKGSDTYYVLSTSSASGTAHTHAPHSGVLWGVRALFERGNLGLKALGVCGVWGAWGYGRSPRH